MLSRIGNALQGAADLVAPPCGRVQDLHFHWHQVEQDCQKYEKKVKLAVVEETHVPKHLKAILKILAEDHAENPNTKVLSPCLEYVVQGNVLRALCSYAHADKPLGIRQYTLMFLSDILQNIHKSHLHQMKIHRPVQMVVHIISQKRASPYEQQEINLISVLCDKVKETPSLILLYIEPEALTKGCSSSPMMSQSAAENNELKQSAGKSRAKFPLVDSILNLCHSCDTSTKEKAHVCLLDMLSLGNEVVSEVIGKHTLLPQYLASRLIVSGECLPVETEHSLIESIATNYRISNKLVTEDEVVDDSLLEELEGDLVGEKEIQQFFKWIIFCDKLMMQCDDVLCSEISRCLSELFLDGFLRPLYSTDNDHDLAALFTAVITNILFLVSSKSFSDCLVSWLMGSDENQIDVNVESNLKMILLQRCRKPPHHLQLQSLRLLQTTLERPGSLAAQILVFNFVSTRGYIDLTPAEQSQNSWSDEEDERYKIRESSKAFMAPEDRPSEELASSMSRTLAPANINKIINRFLYLVPEEIRSTSNDDFDTYQANAIRQYKQVCKRVPLHTWPREAVQLEPFSETSSTASKESQAECEVPYFEEGPLLSLLMDFLENLPEQDYDINLQVTSLISSLALLPHPFLHEFLLNPYIQLSHAARTPYSILTKVISQIRPLITSKPDYRNYLKLTRFQLLGTMEDLEFERHEENGKFEALVVFEEFIKELASIAYAKYICELETTK